MATASAHPKNILTVGLTYYLTGETIKSVIDKDWQKPGVTEASGSFDNEGFDVDGSNFDKAVSDLRGRLHEREWDGVLVGWCLRGYPQRTVMFEKVVGACVEEIDVKRTKLMFCTGPDNLAETVLRSFPVA